MKIARETKSLRHIEVEARIVCVVGTSEADYLTDKRMTLEHTEPGVFSEFGLTGKFLVIDMKLEDSLGEQLVTFSLRAVE